MTTIYTNTADQLLVASVLPALAQNNVESVRLFVDFDSPWDGYPARSAVFTTSRSAKPYEVTIASGFCLVPQEVLAEPCRLYITVKGVSNAGAVKSSTRLTLKVSEGAPSVVISDPTPNVYQQLAIEGAVLSSRMSALEKAGTVDGSEVIGIRTGADGTTYSTAGDAVREQFGKVEATSSALAKGVNRLAYQRYRFFAGGVLQVDEAVANSDEYDITGYSGVVLYPIEAMKPIGEKGPIYNLVFELYSDEAEKSVSVGVSNNTWGNTSTKYSKAQKLQQGTNYVELDLSTWDGPYENEENGTADKIVVYASSGYLDGVTVKGVYAVPLQGYGLTGYIAEKIATCASKWTGKTWVAYGDSITAQCNGQDPTKGWAGYVNECHGFAKFYGRGVGGQRFCYNEGTWYSNADGSYAGRYGQEGLTEAPEGTTTHNGSFCSWDRIKTMIPDSIRESVNLLTVMGGTNDITAGIVEQWARPVWGENNTTDEAWLNDGNFYNGGDFDCTSFVGAIASTIMKLQARCPNALIVAVTPLPRWSGKAPFENKEKTMREVSELIKRTAEFMGIPCIDLNALCGINGFNYTTYISDGVHPNANGWSLMGRALNGALAAIHPVQ